MNKSYEEWLRYYENATKEQVIEDMMLDIAELKSKNQRLNNEIKILLKENETYENMRKLVIEYIKYNATSNYFDSEKNMFRREEDLLNILKKVGESDD